MAAPIPDEQAALLAAIVAQPDDDTLRLIYADFIQEHGDEEQARFIRDSVTLEWLRDHEDEERQKRGARLAVTSDRLGSRWLEALGVTGGEPIYDRGMVEGLIYDGLERFVADVPMLFARVPVRSITIRDLDLHDRDGLTVLADLPDLLRIRELRLENGWEPVSADGFERLVTSPHLARLELLAVQEAQLTDEDVRALDRSEHLGHLEVLGLAANRLTAAGALAVLRSPRLPNLRRLGLAYNDIVEDRRRGSPYLVLRDALIERFDTTAALGTNV
jgi:uncharacterized protein (TIGR02996 family)